MICRGLSVRGEKFAYEGDIFMFIAMRILPYMISYT